MDEQQAICRRFGVAFEPTLPGLKVGIAQNVRTGVLPIHGLRLRAEGSTSGWYLWAGGEMGTAADFFVPLHAAHLADWCPMVIPYLGLPPGWRFLIAPGHEDVWWDESLLVRSPPLDE